MKKLAGESRPNHSLWYFAILIALGMGFVFGCDGGPNTVVAYLQGADQQFENASQGREIEKALNDMLSLGPDELRKRRYADYQMEPGTWTITDILRKYFLPQKPTGLDEDRFYKDVAKPEAKAVIREHLRAVKEAIALDEKESESDAEEEEDTQ